MPTTTDGHALQTGLAELAQAERDGKLTAAAAANIRRWLAEDPYAAYRPELLRHLHDGLWRALDDVFWTVIPFGTGGRRGRMYPIGCNAINERTIGESAQGLAAYVRKQKPQGPWSCGIAYDTRHRSREFAELCAGVLVAAGFTIDFLDDYRSTPELSFLVRRRQCDCGIMVTASHNPPTDNAVKVYAATGGQLVPPDDQGVIDEVARVDRIEKVEFSSAVAAGRVRLEREEADRQLLAAQLQQGFPGPRQLRVIYSPLHGVGEFSVRPLLEADGFRELEIFEPHRKPDGDFPNVPGHVSNPENPQVFDAIIERARQRGADLVLATDPDCDRMGAAAPLRPDSSGPWQTLNGNQLAALLADFVLRRRREAGPLTADHYLVTTLVTTPLLARLAGAYGVRCDADNLVGFKWIGQRMDQLGPQNFVFGAEESHGYLVGDYCRDKDGAVACLLMCELAAEARAAGQTVHQRLDDLHRRFGVHVERLTTVRMEGSDGMRRMRRLMDRLRDDPPPRLGSAAITSLRDYQSGSEWTLSGPRRPLTGPRDNLVMLQLETPGNFIAVRPSGTEPKVKFYLFGYRAAEAGSDLAALRGQLDRFLAGLEGDLRDVAAAI